MVDKASPWQDKARYFANGLPANMDAVLHEQWKRIKPWSIFR